MWTPFDLRLKPPEIMRNLELLKEKCKMFCHLGKTPIADFGLIGVAVKDKNPWLEYIIQFTCKKLIVSVFILFTFLYI